MSRSPYLNPPQTGLGDGELSRTSSLPSGMNMLDAPIQMRIHSTPRAQKRAQLWRSSVAVTNSDYYNQWRPNMVKHVAGVMPSAPSLDTISEYEMRGLCNNDSEDHFRSPLVYQQKYNHQEKDPVADPNMFRYNPTPILDPVRQTVPTPLSRPTTPQIGSVAQNRSTPQPPLSPPETSGGVSNTAFLRGSSQTIHVSAAANNQFLPIYLNPETGNVYMFEEGYYVPVPPKNAKELEKATNMNNITKPPTAVSE